MSIVGLDHVAITVDDVALTVAWYERVLGATPLHFDLWLSGQIPVALLQLGGSRLSVHPQAKPAAPYARRPTPGSADLCFRWDGTIDEAIAQLQRHEVAVIEGPVPRPAADGERGSSVYFRDPDGNLLELLTTKPA
jgi:catechol 2,3-dioxygenase-like lactoylglutathione lyase family enzyme